MLTLTRRAPFVASVVLAACGLLACNRAPATPAANPNAPRDVAAALDAWHDAAARADEDAYFALFAPRGVFLGTDATERWEVDAFRVYAHPHFAKGKAWTFRAVRRAITISESGNVAWFDEDLATTGLGPARGSGVLVRNADGAWRIAQYNLSVPIPNERFRVVREFIAAPPDAGIGR